MDTGSVWSISNNPQGTYFSPEIPGSVGNSEYSLWQVVRASTAAPSYFEAEKIDVRRIPGYKNIKGEFVDGGVSPFNNPALQALMYATLKGYNIG